MTGNPDTIVLGDGVFSVGGVDIGLTRGGGSFSIEREYRQIEADGDYGPVKGRIRKVKSMAKLKVTALELLPANLTNFYPAMLNTVGASSDVLTATADVATTDYNTVAWTGLTKSGKQVVITLQNAINLENIEWGLVDKEEIIAELTYTATYLESARTTEPWNVAFAQSAVGEIVIPVMSILAPIAGATVRIVLSFSEKLHTTTLAITDITNLLSAITNDSITVSVASVVGSVFWIDALTQNPKAIVTIPSTIFVAGKTLRANAKTGAIKDLAGNTILAATNSNVIITA